MKAFTKYTYGGPEVLQMEDLPKPQVKDDEILVKIKANSVNAADWRILRGKPFFARFSFGLFKPKFPILGADFSGIIEAVGKKVEDYEIGDYVFGESIKGGAFAEYISISPKFCGKFSSENTFNQLAGIPMAGLTAYQAIIEQGQVKKNEKVLINGGSGGVGHFCIQICKYLGAEVTAVSSSKNKDFVLSLGADHSISYDLEDLESIKTTYDIIIDVQGNLTYADFKRLGKRGVLIGFTTMKNMISVLLKSSIKKYPLKQFTAQSNSKDLNLLALWFEAGHIKPHLEKIFEFEDTPKAITHIESKRTKGKIVITR
jgi:NADPH:quinone reductase-like Zn-dependent oxidoreductase